MNVRSQNPIEARNPDRAMIRALVGIGILSGLVIAGTFSVTEPMIRQNKQEALDQAIFEIIPDGRSKVAFRFGEQGGFDAVEGSSPRDLRVYAVYGPEERLIGFAIPARGMGYQDFIELLYAYRPSQRSVTGMTVLSSRETPGLGSRIGTDPDFLRGFEHLDVSLTRDLEQIANPIATVRPGRAAQRWQIDGITGATVSSQAVGEILRQSTAFWIPKIAQHLGEFERGDAGHRN